MHPHHKSLSFHYHDKVLEIRLICRVELRHNLDVRSSVPTTATSSSSIGDNGTSGTAALVHDVETLFPLAHLSSHIQSKPKGPYKNSTRKEENARQECERDISLELVATASV